MSRYDVGRETHDAQDCAALSVPEKLSKNGFSRRPFFFPDVNWRQQNGQRYQTGNHPNHCQYRVTLSAALGCINVSRRKHVPTVRIPNRIMLLNLYAKFGYPTDMNAASS